MLFMFNDYIGPNFIPDQKYWNNHYLLSLLRQCLYVIRDRYDFRDMPELDELNYPGIQFYYDKSTDEVIIYHFGSLKKQVDITEMPDDELEIYWPKFLAYRKKRYADIAKLEIMAWHWQDLVQQWKELLAQKPKYLIMEIIDEIPPQKIKMTGKDELSPEDIAYFTEEHEKYLKYEKARQRYAQAHPDYSDDVWRGPQDDEFEADIMRYYED